MRNAYDPFFIIKIDGKSASKNLTERIIKFEFEDTDDKDDILSLLIDNNDLTLTDDESISEGGIISFCYGYLDRVSPFKKAKIKDVEGFKEIKITAYQISSEEQPMTPSISPGAPQSLPVENQTYTVKKGDNLTKIAKVFGVSSWKDLYNDAANKKVIGSNPNLIFPGQKLVIPSKNAVPKTSNDSPNTSSATSSSSPDNSYAQKSRVFEKMKYSDVASKISEEFGLTPIVEDSKIKYDSIPQTNEDNIEFLRRLAKEIGYIVYMSGSDLHFHPADYSTSAQRKLTYYVKGAEEVMDFYPRLKTQKVSSKANVASTSTMDKSKKDDKVGQTANTKLGKTSYVVDGITGKETRVVTPLKSSSNSKLDNNIMEDEMSGSGETSMNESEKRWIEADISCIGIPEITAAGIIEIQGVGKKWSGNWYMKTVRHTIDGSGYVTSIECTRNALNKPAKISDDVEGSINDSKGPDSGSSSEGSKPAHKKMIVVDGVTGKESTQMMH